MAYDILDFLFDVNIGVAFLTKGHIPMRHLKLLQANASQVRAQIGLTTLDEGWARIFEPHAATPSLRLAQAKALMDSGVITQVRLDPIFPGLTDGEELLDSLCAKLAEARVKRIAASTLFLRPAVVRSLRQHLREGAMLDTLIKHFEPQARLAIHAERSSVVALPVDIRRRIYARVKRIAHRYGIAVRVCACKNPDLATESCSIAGDWSHPSPRPVQRGLFDECERR